MEGSIAIGPADRKTLLRILRAAVGLRSRRAHIVLLAADGWSVRQIRLATFASFDFIAASVRLYRRQGMTAFAEPTRRRALPPWAKLVARWVAKRTPRDFGYFRRRWSCETLTRNHRCPTLDDLLRDVYEWIDTRKSFYGRELLNYANAA